jgi:hypothetical protein
MASAILATLYPDDFTVYDYRVCDLLGGFHNLAAQSKFDNVWRGYELFRDQVRQSTPADLSLRDKDRYLWGKSASAQLVRDLRRNFDVFGTGSEG